MAQFVEVMNQARRICLEHPGDCDGCPLHDDDGLVCRFALGEKYLSYDTAERIVLKWAEEHPEYPSWYQYQETTFPGHTRWICPMVFGVECPSKSTTDAHACKVCRDNPIPAVVAEKLGIKPKEALNDAKIH